MDVAVGVVSNCSKSRSTDDADDDADGGDTCVVAVASRLRGDKSSVGRFIFLRLGRGTGARLVLVVAVGDAGPEWQETGVSSRSNARPHDDADDVDIDTIDDVAAVKCSTGRFSFLRLGCGTGDAFLIAGAVPAGSARQAIDLA